jgi:hypothetical protein
MRTVGNQIGPNAVCAAGSIKEHLIIIGQMMEILKALGALKPSKLCRLLKGLLFLMKETGNLKLETGEERR